MRSSSGLETASRSWPISRRSAAAAVAGVGRIEAGAEEVDQGAGELRIARQRLLHVRLAERGLGLPQVLAVGAQDAHLAGDQAGAQHELVEGVVLQLAAPDLLEGLVEGLAHGRDVHRRAVLADQAEVAHPDRRIGLAQR